MRGSRLTEKSATKAAPFTNKTRYLHPPALRAPSPNGEKVLKDPPRRLNKGLLTEFVIHAK